MHRVAKCVTALLVICIFGCYGVICCLTPQGERGRDGVDGLKGDPVSHSSTLTLMILLHSIVLIFHNDIDCSYQYGVHMCVCV